MPAPEPTSPHRLRLTQRGRVAAAVAALVALLLLAALVRSCGSPAAAPRGSRTAPPSSAPAPSSSPPAATSSPASSPAATTAPTPAPTPSGGTDRAMVRTGARGDGTWTVAPVPTGVGTTRGAHRYAVKVEGGTGIDPAAAAREIASILGDQRSWHGTEGATFEQVADPAQARFTIFLASPPTTDRMCLPLRTLGTWSCRHGDDVILNSDRWLHMTPSYDDLQAYRAYQVNHEVGHFLGHGHQGCSGAGRNAPVMMQQSKGTGTCRPNPWPADDGR